MISKLFLISLAVLSPFVPQEQVYEDFDTFQTAVKYEEDFDYVVEKRNSYGDGGGHEFESDYSSGIFYYYALPIYYDVILSTYPSIVIDLFYSNSFYNFYNVSYNGFETVMNFDVFNYIGIEQVMPFIAFTSVGMSQIIEHDKVLPENDKSLFGSFFAFFTGFFPQTVVSEYNGIFTAIVVAFLLFLVFGFIFFLFRTIRRLMGFR